MSKRQNTYHKSLVIILFLMAVGMLCAGVPALTVHGSETSSTKGDDDKVKLLHADVLYKTPYDRETDILVGHVRLYHDGMYLNCDSARVRRNDNSFDAFGHVSMKQGDTLSLTSDTLLYSGNTAHAIGRAVLKHRKTTLKTSVIDYERYDNIGYYPNHGTLYDGDNVLDCDYGQYNLGTREAIFRDNVVLKNPKFDLKTTELYYYTTTKRARIVEPTNIITSDSTFIYTAQGEYDTNTEQAYLVANDRYNGEKKRPHIVKEMRDIYGDSLYSDKHTSVSEAFGNVVLKDEENKCMLTGDYCRYEENTGTAIATDRAVCYEYSEKDTLYVHGDTLKMISHNQNTDSVYRDLYAYHKVRLYRRDIQGVCDSLVSHELDSCTYLYGQPILWNEGQQIVGEEMRVYNNDSTIDWIHVINQAMTIERLDSVSYNQVASKEIFCYFKDGVIDRNHAKGNVYVDYYMTEGDSVRIGMNYTETTELKTYMRDKKLYKIWMPAATSTMYPPFAIPEDKRYLTGFAWFDDLRPKEWYDIFDWKEKDADKQLTTTVQRHAPKQKLEDIEKEESEE